MSTQRYLNLEVSVSSNRRTGRSSTSLNRQVVDTDAGQGADIVTLRPAGTPAPTESLTRRTECWSESWQGEPSIFLPECLGIEHGLALARERAERDLAPAAPKRILSLLSKLAIRHELDLPDEDALHADISVMSSWPADLFERAFQQLWGTWRYRRFPTCGDIHALIADDLAERRNRRACLSEAELKLQTVRLREIWDAESRQRRARTSPEKGSAAV
jgi:hypothetical protein